MTTTPRTRRWRRSLLALMLSTGALALSAPAESAHAASGLGVTHWYSYVSYRCNVDEYNQLRVYVTENAWAVGDRVRQIRVKARLIPTTSGHNRFRSWSREAKTAAFSPQVGWSGAINSYWTNGVSVNADWQIEVQVRFDRNNRPDYVYTNRYPIDNEYCGGLGGGRLIAESRRYDQR